MSKNKSNNRNRRDQRGRNNKGYSDPRDKRDSSYKSSDAYSQREGEDVSQAGKGNDPSWYMHNQQLVHDVTRIPFSYTAGFPLLPETDDNWQYATYYPGGNAAAPGVCVLATVPTPGDSYDANSAINLAANGLFQFVRKNLSTVASYQSADMMMYILGIDQIFTLYTHILRAFGLANVYSGINRYYGDALLKAIYAWSDSDVAAFRNGFSDLRARFNNLIYKASALYLPTDFTLTARHSWLYSNVFLDRASIKGQLYAHTLPTIWVLDETTSTSGTALVPEWLITDSEEDPWKGRAMTQLLTTFSNMIEAYRNSDSMQRIAADLRRAFQDRQFYKLSYCDEAYIVMPTASDEVLLQIHNTDMLMYPEAGESSWIRNWNAKGNWIISQDVDKNCILFTPGYTYPLNEPKLRRLYGSKLVNMIGADPTDAAIMVATRGKIHLEAMQDGDDSWTAIKYLASDFCLDARFAVMEGDELRFITMHSMAGDDVKSEQWRAIVWSAFDWAPAMDVYDADSETGGLLWEIDNVAPLPVPLYRQLQENVVLSLWSIPQLGAYDS